MKVIKFVYAAVYVVQRTRKQVEWTSMRTDYMKARDRLTNNIVRQQISSQGLHDVITNVQRHEKACLAVVYMPTWLYRIDAFGVV